MIPSLATNLIIKVQNGRQNIDCIKFSGAYSGDAQYAIGLPEI